MKTIFIVLGIAVVLTSSFKINAQWVAQPIEVHEWGVSQFDWSSGKQMDADLPEFVFTRQRPGVQYALGKDTTRVRDLPADSGIRTHTKPIVYFYGPQGRDEKPIPVALEVRFDTGHAQAWWPQCTVYRTPEEVSTAEPPDLEAWNRLRKQKLRAHFESQLKGEKLKEALAALDRRSFLRNDPSLQKQIGSISQYPDDERFELVWDRLELSTMFPAESGLRDAGLSENHWWHLARDVDSAYVYNGYEADKFLFYEGQSRELPAIALIPHRGFGGLNSPSHLVYNVSEFPIFDVFIVYRNTPEDHYWVSYLDELQPLARRHGEASPTFQSAPHDLVPAIPNFERLPLDLFMDEREFLRRTETMMMRVLTKERSVPNSLRYQGRLRDPGQYQPPTVEHRLFRKEVIAFMKIWRKDLFGHEGLTVVYRESPAYLDKIVPLRVYTDMEHYINLSRCSLVINHGIDLNQVSETHSDLSLKLFSRDDGGAQTDARRRAVILNQFRKDGLGTLALLSYYKKISVLPPGLDVMVNELTDLLGNND